MQFPCLETPAGTPLDEAIKKTKTYELRHRLSKEDYQAGLKCELRLAIRKRLLSAAKSRAKARGLPFNLQLEDIEIPDMCPVLGIPLMPQFGIGSIDDMSPTLDRVRPELGYIRGNVAVVSARANRIKSDGQIEELEMWVDYLRRHYDRAIATAMRRPNDHSFSEAPLSLCWEHEQEKFAVTRREEKARLRNAVK